MGCIRPVVVAELTFPSGVKMKYVLDGQGLLLALMGLGMAVPYVTVDPNDDPETTVDYIAMMNATSVKWDIKDYVYAWKFIKNSYRQLERYSMMYSLHYSAVTAIAMNIESIDNCAPIIKAGEFRIINENFRQLCDIAMDLLEVEGLGNIQRVPNRFVAELVRYYNNIEVYEHDVIKQRIRDHIEIIRAVASSTVNGVLREYIFILPIEDEDDSNDE